MNNTYSAFITVIHINFNMKTNINKEQLYFDILTLTKINK